jgi:two-component system sensor histidine kinase PilS (NtrC family)
MDIVLRESDRLNETIRNFLVFARPQRTAITNVDLRSVLSDTARLLENHTDVTERHSWTWRYRGARRLPRRRGADPQIVWNLATNGLRAMPSGGHLRLSAATGTRPSDGTAEAVLAVTDEGVGIAPEDMDGIFQPFRGGFSRGTGLGLSIVHRIATEHGGKSASPRKREGTRVEVALR